MSYFLIRFNNLAYSKIASHTFLRYYVITAPKSNFTVCPVCKYHYQIHHSKQGTIHNVSRNSSTYTKPNEIAIKSRRKRRNFRRYVELIQVGNKDGSSATEKLAKIKKSSATNVLKKLGIKTTINLPEINASLRNESLKSNEPSSSAQQNLISDSNIISNEVEESTFSHEHSFEGSQNIEGASLNNSLMNDISINDPLDNIYFEGMSASFNENLQHCDMGYASFLNEDLLYSEECEPVMVNNKLPEKVQDRKTAISHSTEQTSHKKPKVTFKQTKHKSLKQNTEMLQKTKSLMHEEKLAKRRSLQNNLLSYLDVCINNRMIHHANNMLMNYSKKFDLSSEKKAVDLFNLVLHGWAAECNWEKLTSLLNYMENKGPRPNLQSYSAAIECLVRKQESQKEISELLKRIQKKGLHLEDILEECVFLKDQKERVLEGILCVYPSFQPKKSQKSNLYDCQLLQNLNSEMPQDRYYSPVESLFSKEKLAELAALQLKMESHGQIKIKSIIKRQTHSEKYLHWRKIVNHCEDKWRKSIQKMFQENVEQLKKETVDKNSTRLGLYPYMIALKQEDYVNLMIQEIETISQLSEGFSSMLSAMQMVLGKKIMERYFLQKKKKNGILEKIRTLYEQYCDYYCDPKLTSKHIPRHYWAVLQDIHCNGPNTDLYADKLWPPHVLLNIGQFLYKILMKAVLIDVNILKSGNKPRNMSPVFFTVYRKHNIVKIREEIKPHPTLVRLYRLANYDNLTFDASIVPMISPPLPWTSIHSGGFLLASTPLIRFPYSFAPQKLNLDKIDLKNLFPVFDSLNQLAECPWKINEPILDVVIHVFNNKGSVELDIPQPISECQPMPKYKGLSKHQLAKVLQERAAVKQKRAEMYSLWCDMLYKLSIANQFRKDIVWFPHNIDFRGRVYPCPPHFNHLGSDVSRSLLLFAKGEEIGEKGLQWLKIHLVNLTGFKKRSSLKERLKYCDEIMDDVMDSADKPLTGRQWWMKSDEPWQTLACCMELTKCLRSPNPERYICHFPVHQDGSCNGLQHYAALGRDEQGAEQVNLSPKNVPQDVYSKVAEMVENERIKDAGNNVKIAQVLEGFISRKVIKQPVMTTVYGVTRYGAHHQIIKQLKDIPNFPKEYQWQAASYLVTKTFYSLQKMFSATKQIQDWLTESANLISSVYLQPVQWVTPLGLPILQPYFKYKKIQNLQFQQDKNNPRHQWRPFFIQEVPNTRKQKNAFPPNYIHSLDSTHMMLTGLYCQRAGVSFVSVHDCFWTHPSTIDIMNKICREQFVALHSQPLLSDLSKNLVEKHVCQNMLQKLDINPSSVLKHLTSVPETGQFALEKVLKSTYFFS